MDTLAGLYASQPFWIWAGLGAALLAIEVMTGSGWLLWAAASAVVTAVAVALVDLTVPAALVIFAILTSVSTLAARRYFPRTVPDPAGKDINDNIGRLVGHHGSAVQAFAARNGRVSIDGKEWAAELDDGEGLEAGAEVKVTGVHGSRLQVRRA